MAAYVIGDVQGCREALERLLDRIRFEPGSDRLWFVGDLINRGPDSLGVLRLVRSLGDHAVTVMGNHELHLLARSFEVAPKRRRDTLEQVLAARDVPELVDWVRHLPVLHHEGSHLMVHAGLLPAWTIPDARDRAARVEETLRSDRARFLLHHIYESAPSVTAEGAAGLDDISLDLEIFTRIRLCHIEDATPAYHFAGRPEEAPAGLVPWYELPSPRHPAPTIVFGHWSALGLRSTPEILAVDTGCVWGGALTAVRLEDRRAFQVEADPGDRR